MYVMYVCMYVCMNEWMNEWMYVCMYVYVCVCVCVCVCAHILNKFPRDSEASMTGSPAAVPELFPPEHRSLAMQCQNTSRPTLELLGSSPWGTNDWSPRYEVLSFLSYMWLKPPVHVVGPRILAYVDRNSLDMLRDRVSRGLKWLAWKP